MVMSPQVSWLFFKAIELLDDRSDVALSDLSRR
jgi:hypothetical protein